MIIVKIVLIVTLCILFPAICALLYSPLLGTDLDACFLREAIIERRVLFAGELFCVYLALSGFGPKTSRYSQAIAYMVLIAGSCALGLSLGAPAIQWPS